jgi:transposase InsO family protein
MPWRKVNVSDQRLEFVVRASEVGSNIAALSREFGISRQTGHTWLKRYQQGGAKAVVEERSRRPHQSPRATGAALVAAIKALRQDKPDWGARKLLALLPAKKGRKGRQKQISLTTVHRILEREGLIAAEDRRKPAPQRFERQEPNELWQMDFKGPQGFNKGLGPLSILDDYSRYLLALQQLGSTRLKGVQATLQATFEANGLPEYLLVDHGTPWYNGWSAWGWTELTVWIMRQGIRVILSGVRHPQTQGKVERMHGSLQRAMGKRKAAGDQKWLDEFRYEYNHVRPHEGIGMIVPSQRWRPSPRPYQEKPREWEYPAGWEIHRLAGEGQLNWRRQRWEISRALRYQLVGLQRCQERVLVHFCNVALREIDLRSGQNVILPVNPFRELHC